MRTRRIEMLSLAVLLLSSCGGGGTTATPTATTASPTISPTPTPELSLDELVALPDQGYSLQIECFGEGAPTTVLEAGSADDGIGSFSSLFLKAVASNGGTACTYDRLGTGQSDDPAHKRRTLRDQVDDLHALLAETGLPTPYVLAGSSWGGFVVMDLAAAYPQDVGAVVLLDVPAPNATITQADVGGPWDAPGNPEFVDAVEAEHRLANHPPAIRPIPLRVVTASFGQSSVKDQSFWTKLSPKSDSVLLEGGHVIYEDDAQGSIDQILEAIRSV